MNKSFPFHVDERVADFFQLEIVRHFQQRFRRADANTINYRFTVDDPTTFTAPFTGEIPFRAMDELIYEYACHEGNYALANVLSGARNEEKRLGSKQ